MFGFNELSTPVKATIALAFVLVLVVLAGLILRRIAGGRLKLGGQGSRARQPRLGIVDIFELDRQRQLVLLRRDNVEHLVMIGGPNDVVVEASIVRGAARAQMPPPEPADAALAEPKPVRAPPAVKLPTAPEAADAEPPRAPSPPPVSAPAPVPMPASSAQPPVPPTAQRVPAGAAAAAALAAGAAARALPASTAQDRAAEPAQPAAPSPIPDQIAASFEAEFAGAIKAPDAPVATPGKPILEPIAPPPMAKASQTELDDMTRQLQEALKRPFSGVRPAPAVALPSDAPAPPRQRTPEPKPDAAPAPEPAIEPEPERASDAGSKAEPEAAGPVAQAVRIGAFEPIAPTAAPPAPTGTPTANPAPVAALKPVETEAGLPPLLDLELEREMANAFAAAPAAARPASPQGQPQVDGAKAAAATAPSVDEASAKAKPDAAAIAPAAKPTAAAGSPAAVEPPGKSPASTQPAKSDGKTATPGPSAAAPAAQTGTSKAKPEPTPPPTPKPTPKAEAEPAPEGEPSRKAEAAPTPKPAPAENDPFSVDAIEAEFARLLNRTAPPKG